MLKQIVKGIPYLSVRNGFLTIPLRYILFFTLFLCKKHLTVFYSIDCFLQLSYNLGLNFWKAKKKRSLFFGRKTSLFIQNVRNYNKINPKKQDKNTLFKIMGDISHLFGNEIPYPQSHYYSNEHNRMVYCWYIEFH